MFWKLGVSIKIRFIPAIFKIRCPFSHCSVFILFSGCTDDHIFETKTFDVGHDVTLTCTRQKSWTQTHLFWIRLVSGTFPEILGGTLSYDYEGVSVTGHIAAKQEPGKFVLNINKAQLSDTAVYYCVKVKRLNMTFLKGIFLRVKGKYSKNSNTDFRCLCHSCIFT